MITAFHHFDGTHFLCCIFQDSTVRHRGQDIEPLLSSFVVISMDELDDGFLKFMIGAEFVQIVHFTLQDPPESFHWTIVYTSTNTGHALNHTCFIKFMFELSVGVLITTVAVKQRFRIRILLDSKVKCVKDQLVVIARTYRKRYDAIVLKIKDCAEVEFLTITVLHLSHIGQPLLIKLFSGKVSVQNIFCCDFRSRASISRSLSSDDRLQAYNAR